MKIQIYGTGCDKCNKLYQAAKAAADELGVEYEIEKISEVSDIVTAGVMMTPALGIDGTIKVEGKVPSNDDMKALLT